MTSTQPPRGPTDAEAQVSDDPMIAYTQSLYLFSEAVKLAVGERVFMEYNRHPNFSTNVELQILLDSAMASIQRVPFERAQAIFQHSPTTPVEHAARYAAALTVAERLAGVLKIPPSCLGTCIMTETIKKINELQQSSRLVPKPPVKSN